MTHRKDYGHQVTLVILVITCGHTGVPRGTADAAERQVLVPASVITRTIILIPINSAHVIGKVS